jgi:condensin complex subunit 2
VKKFDLDFSVDPLFKKTSADFDEGGARGLLLNHLGIDGNCKIIFDASDATIETEESDNKQDETEEQDENKQEEEKDDPMEVDEQTTAEQVGEIDVDELIKEGKKPVDDAQSEGEAKVDENKEDEAKDGEQAVEEDKNQVDGTLLEEPDASQSEQTRIDITRLRGRLMIYSKSQKSRQFITIFT